MSSSDRYFPISLEMTDEGDMKYPLPVDNQWSVAQVKTEIKQKIGVDTSNITLNFNGTVLKDNDVLYLVGIKKDSKISMAIKVNGG